MLRPLTFLLAAFALAAPAVAVAEETGGLAGGPGDWIVIYHPLPEPVSEVDYAVDYRFSTGTPVGTPLSYWVIEPAAVIERNGERMIWGREGPLAQHRSLGGDAGSAWRGGGGITIGGPGIVGFVVAASSTAPWVLDSTISVDGIALPAIQVRGTDATFAVHKAVDSAAPLPGAGAITIDADFERAGWKHLQVAVRHLEPIGVRHVDADFASGFSVSRTGAMVGASAPYLGGTAAGFNYVGAAGDSSDAPGAFDATIAIAEGSIDAAALLVHLPMETDALPPELRHVRYVEGVWPFSDL